jgi:2',3'-cyclic-nucleotide 2'-phosphodiesterase
MKILFIGDIVGRPGRNAVKAILPDLEREFAPDLVLANGENLASGLGMTLEKYNEMIDVGIDYFTSGNHIWAKKDFLPHLDDPTIRVIRPANYPNHLPGRGVVVLDVGGRTVQLINLVGKSFMKEESNDYHDTIDEILATTQADIRIVDFHAEATSEKAILGFYLDGKVTAVLGTHTHVPTADERLLPQGTAFQTDIGMVGPWNSSLGAKIEPFLSASRYNTAPKYEIAGGPVVFNATLIELDESNKVRSIARIQRFHNLDS